MDQLVRTVLKATQYFKTLVRDKLICMIMEGEII